MDAFNAPVFRRGSAAFNQALVSSEASYDIGSYLDSACGYSDLDNSIAGCPQSLVFHPNTYIVDPQLHTAPTPEVDYNVCEELCFLNWIDGGACAQESQTYCQLTPVSVPNNAVAHPEIPFPSAPILETSPTCPSLSYSSGGSSSGPWDDWENHDYSTLAPGLPPQQEQWPTTESEVTSPQSTKAKKKRVKGPANCAVCGTKFDKPCQLREHMREHGDQYQCSVCGQTFLEACNLAVHKKKHQAVPQTCELCSKVFTNAASYRSHKCCDSQRERVKCPFTGCDREYTQQGGLNRHLKSHNPQHNIKCGDCGKSFTRLDGRDRHQEKYCKKAKQRRAPDDEALAMPLSEQLESWLSRQIETSMHMQTQIQAQPQPQPQAPSSITRPLNQSDIQALITGHSDQEHQHQQSISTIMGITTQSTQHALSFQGSDRPKQTMPSNASLDLEGATMLNPAFMDDLVFGETFDESMVLGTGLDMDTEMVF